AGEDADKTGGIDIKVDREGRPTGDASFAELKITKLTDMRKFERMKRSNEIYEMSKRSHIIRFDEQGNRYYLDHDKRKIFNPDGDEYYLENGRQVHIQGHETTTEVRTDVTWSGAMTSNDSGHGSWRNQVFIRGDFATGIELRWEPGKARVINARLLHG